MSVSIEQKISAYSADGINRGHLTVEVTVTNQGNEPILGSSSGLGFFLQNTEGGYVDGFHRTDPPLVDQTGPIPNGGSFHHEIHFDTGPVDIEQQYLLTCIFNQTKDHDSETFTFRPLFLDTPGIAPFNR